MQNLKAYLQDRLQFLQQVAAADKSEDCLSVLGQIHEIKTTLYWIEDYKNQTANTTETQPHAHTTTPTDSHRTYADGVKDAYNDVLHMIYADGYNADAIAKALENATEKTPCNN